MCLKDSHASYLRCNIGKTTPALCSKSWPNYCVYFHFEPFREEGKSLEVDLKNKPGKLLQFTSESLKKKKNYFWPVWWHTALIPALRQILWEFEAHRSVTFSRKSTKTNQKKIILTVIMLVYVFDCPLNRKPTYLFVLSTQHTKVGSESCYSAQ